MMANGDQAYTEALKMILGSEDESNSEEATRSLLLEAINSGLSNQKDECMAYAFLGSSYCEDSQYSKSIECFRKSFSIKKILDQETIAEWNAGSMLKYWQAAANKFGLVLCIEGEALEERQEYWDALELYGEAVESTDHVIAHQKLAQLHELMYKALEKKKHLKDARTHIEYIINNSDKLSAFPQYQESLFWAREALERLNKASKGCFIATACYGASDAPEVETLRNFRDDTLIPSVLGKWFVYLYYMTSPPLARYISKSESRKNLIRHYFLRHLLWFVKKYREKGR